LAGCLGRFPQLAGPCGLASRTLSKASVDRAKPAICRHDALHFHSSGLERKHWPTATPIREIFRDAFAAVGLPYFNPHSFRKTLVALGQQCCKSPEEFKAWSQNLGHEGVLTTLHSYGRSSNEPTG
jgi:hypothetical protein